PSAGGDDVALVRRRPANLVIRRFHEQVCVVPHSDGPGGGGTEVVALDVVATAPGNAVPAQVDTRSREPVKAVDGQASDRARTAADLQSVGRAAGQASIDFDRQAARATQRAGLRRAVD